MSTTKTTETRLIGVAFIAIGLAMTASLLETNLRMKDFLQLKLGDIIPTETKINTPMSIAVNGRKKLLAKPGLSGKKRAFQVIGSSDEMAKEITQ